MFAAHIIYSGRVQGVGFRYTVCQYARNLEVAGWVKNLPDGRVEIKAEGNELDVDELCKRVESHFEGKISGKQQSLIPSTGAFTGFDIVY